MDTTTTRRGFLTAGAGLVLALTLPVGRGRAQTVAAAGSGAAPFAPNAFVRIGTDDLVTVMIKHLEMGQGSYTGLSTLVAEELEASWSQMRAEGAPANDELYANTYLGTQLTGGSTGLGNSYIQMRKAGATAREMLVAAAAAEWGVPASEITVKEGVIAHAASGKSSGFGALADAAAKQAVPSDPAIKDPKDFKLIGTMLPVSIPRRKATVRPNSPWMSTATECRPWWSPIRRNSARRSPAMTIAPRLRSRAW
ncbi:molybdopterin cofactor-binding domain-containing protein [Paracoccus cavernae]|uniref:molybdopterin cofactor-binding domain-containing protein n=1 Tax=Paracoccus cavernae TaxID=1571207 RepID=UPI00362D963D